MTCRANSVEGEQFANAFFTLETKIKIAKMYVTGPPHPCSTSPFSALALWLPAHPPVELGRHMANAQA